jgi:hypothetical protein
VSFSCWWILDSFLDLGLFLVIFSFGFHCEIHLEFVLPLKKQGGRGVEERKWYDLLAKANNF